MGMLKNFISAPRFRLRNLLDPSERPPLDSPAHMSGTGKALRTPLYGAHVKLKARMVDFHGWEMPIQYAGIIDEHVAVRTRVGLFDLSHMGRVRVQGKDRR